MSETEDQKVIAFLREQLAQRDIELSKVKAELEWFRSKYVIRRRPESTEQIPDSCIVGGV